MGLAIEEVLEKATQDGTLPGFVLLAADKTGKFSYSKCHGVRSTKPESNTKPIDENTVILLASCTKLMVAISALQCVERGLIGLDDDVGKIVPALGKSQIITGFDDEAKKAILHPKTKPITLRNLLNHSSGFAYELLTPNLIKWRTSTGGIPWSGKTIEERCDTPLIFEPETSWMYGPGTNWAGKIVELVTGQTLDEYMAKNIWDPLGLKSTTFWPLKRPDCAERLADVSMYDASGKCVPLAGYDVVNGLEECLGGGGCYSTARDYMTLLQAVMNWDPKLLTESSYKELFTDQLPEASKTALPEVLTVDLDQNIPKSIPKTWSLGGMLTLDDHEGFFSKGTLFWGGMTGLAWFIDRQNGICGIAASQVIAFRNQLIHDLFGEWKQAMLESYKASVQ